MAGVSGISDPRLTIKAQLFQIHGTRGSFAGLKRLRFGEWELEFQESLSLEIDLEGSGASVPGSEAMPEAVVNGRRAGPDEMESLLAATDFRHALSSAVKAVLSDANTTSRNEQKPVFPDGQEEFRDARSIYSSDAGITAMTVMEGSEDTGDLIVVGTETGAIRALRLDGQVVWEENAGARINALQPFSAGDTGSVAASLWDRSVALFSEDGEVLWRRELPVPRDRAPGAGPMTTAANRNGRKELAVGSGYLDIYRLDESGEIVWRAEGYHRGVNAISHGDFNGDGREELVVGMEWSNLQKETGNEVETINQSSGLNWTAVKTATFLDEETAAVLAGSADGWFEFWHPRNRERSWSLRLGGMVRDIAVWTNSFNHEEGFLVGTGGFQLYALDLEGNILWHRRLSDRVERIVIAGRYAWVGTADGKVRKLNGDADVIEQYDLADPIVEMVLLKRHDGIAAATESGGLWHLKNND